MALLNKFLDQVSQVTTLKGEKPTYWRRAIVKNKSDESTWW